MSLFSQQQPSFTDLATMFKATGGRYDPTTPSGQAQLRQDMMRAAQRAEAFRNAASAVREREALQKIQASESSRPSQEVAPGVRAIVKDGQVVGYSTPPQAGRKAVFRDLPYGATSLDQVSEVARAIPAGWRTASDEALAMGDQAAPFQKGFLSALQKAQAAKSAPPAASDAAPGATMPPSQSPGPWAAGYGLPQKTEPPKPWETGMTPAQRDVEGRRLVQEMERLRNLMSPKMSADMSQRQKFADIAHLYELLQPLRKQLETGTSPNNWGGAPIPLTPERRAVLQQQVDELTNKIREASAATQGFGVSEEDMRKYFDLKRQLEALGIPAPF